MKVKKKREFWKRRVTGRFSRMFPPRKTDLLLSEGESTSELDFS